MQFTAGQLVISRKGRDVTKVYMVVGQEKERLLLADGGKWTLKAPKRKNVRHVTATATVLESGRADSDNELKAALAAYTAALKPQEEDRKLV